MAKTKVTQERKTVPVSELKAFPGNPQYPSGGTGESHRAKHGHLRAVLPYHRGR